MSGKYDNLGDRGVGLFVMGVTGLTLTSLTFAMRLWTRARIVKAFGADDWVIVVTQAFYMWSVIDTIILSLVGFGQHVENLDIDQIVTGFMHALLAEVAYAFSVFGIRLSVCILYLRLTAIPWQRYTLYTLVTVNGLYCLGYVILCLNQCHPVSYAWNQWIETNGYCLPDHIVPDATYGHNSLSVLSDWTLAAMPVFLLKDTQMNFRAKCVVILLLGLGSFASIAAIVRITVLDGLLNNPDYTYRVAPVILWAGIETTLGIVANNISTCRPIFKRFLGDKTKSTNHYYYDSQGRKGSLAKSFSKPGSRGYILNHSGTDRGDPENPEGIELSQKTPWVITKKSEICFETESKRSDEDDSPTARQRELGLHGI